MKHFTKQPNNHPALTLLELVVTVAIFAILTLIITRLYVQVLNAQDRILDEQNIVSDLNYATGILLDEARRATSSSAVDFGCGSCAGKYFCDDSDNKVCMTSRALPADIPVYYKLTNNLIEANRAGNAYFITSSDVTFPNTFILQATTTGDQLLIQIEAAGDSQYGQNIYYENYITR